MKKLLVTAAAVATAASVFAQGTINFNTFVTPLKIKIYAPLAPGSTNSQSGNATTDTPAGTTSWAGYTAIGASGLGAQFGANTTFVQLLGAQGLNQAESSLRPAIGGGITTFRTGAAAGYCSQATPTFNNIAADYSGGATVELVAWDASAAALAAVGANYTLGSWGTEGSKNAYDAWQAGLIAAAKSNLGNITAAIGGTGTPPFLPSTLQSFNLYYIGVIPEPSTFALAGLGAAALLIFRRRK